ncbi:efflux RND transporter periplasmic adaptor subunit [Paraglaciecola arctica]|uniref:Macrolide-specific efflux protein MacA n=1 Tax=Paraglaciecola arctica BSs20135 TaxID=493475 RepID=K6Y722_9ALTE|nr:efflux RND transporter periplasmic adaptor subunit [Paraglaciecola arctica]GAC19751.1 macrolide-specific efflux protein MacA [Paraglaciecola arctica BSs20135]
MKTSTKIITGVIILAIAGVVIFQLTKKEENKGIEVEIAKVELATIIQKVNATGKIQPKTKVNISADVSAKITKLEVKEGDWVEKGQFLLELDRERYIASMESEEANVRSAQGQAKLIMENLKQTKRVLERAKELVAKKLDSQANLDIAEAAHQVELARHESALDRVEQTRGMLKQSKDALSKTTIYAPMSGTISKLNKELGEIAIGSQFQEDVIMIIANLNDMEALVKVDENDIVSIVLGQQAEIEVDALLGKKIVGQVSEIASSAVDQQPGNNNQKTEFEVTISITSNVKELRPGMTASADIVTDTREQAVSVPLQSVTVRTAEQLKSEGKTYTPGEDGFVEVVFVVNNNKVEAKQVTTGIQGEASIEIIQGVSAGQDIVIGSYRAISRELENDSEVSVKEKGDN